MPNAEATRGVDFMHDLAERTGGVSVTAEDTPDPAAAARRIATAMRNRYVIGYRPPDGGSPDKWHAISVKVDRTRVNVYSRTGYRQH
jgi:VWFA-related protein